MEDDNDFLLLPPPLNYDELSESKHEDDNTTAKEFISRTTAEELDHSPVYFGWDVSSSFRIANFLLKEVALYGECTYCSEQMDLKQTSTPTTTNTTRECECEALDYIVPLGDRALNRLLQALEDHPVWSKIEVTVYQLPELVMSFADPFERFSHEVDGTGIILLLSLLTYSADQGSDEFEKVNVPTVDKKLAAFLTQHHLPCPALWTGQTWYAERLTLPPN